MRPEKEDFRLWCVDSLTVHTVVQRFDMHCVCPGYGQGAMIICRALAKLNDLERTRITGLIFFSQERPWGAIGKVPRGLHDRCLDIALPKDYLVLSEVLFGIKYRSCQLAFPATIRFIEEKMGEY